MIKKSTGLLRYDWSKIRIKADREVCHDNAATRMTETIQWPCMCVLCYGTNTVPVGQQKNNAKEQNVNHFRVLPVFHEIQFSLKSIAMLA